MKEIVQTKENIVYVIQEIAGTRVGRPKINIIGATRYGNLKFLLKEDSQIICLKEKLWKLLPKIQLGLPTQILLYRQ